MLDTVKDVVPRPVRSGARNVLRAYGVASSNRRALPDFLIIGAKRGGTTSLWRYLEQHPLLAPSFPPGMRFKGAHFFDTGYGAGLAWYRSHFISHSARRHLEARFGGRVVVGEASPYYLFHPCAAERAANAVPDAKIVLLLRNPVDRAYSHYKARRRDGTEPFEFEDALEAEDDRLAGEAARIRTEPGYASFAHEHYSYVSQGLYLEPLLVWLRYYPRERVHVERSEDMFRSPQQVYARVLQFLGLPSWPLRPTEIFNAARAKPMLPTTRSALLKRVASPNRELERLLGRAMNWA